MASASEYWSINIVSGVNVNNFISRELHFGVDSNNYIPWKEQMLCLLESQNLLGFIDGESVAPEPSSQDYVVWRRSDRLVKGWILGALSDELVRKCVKYDTARLVWFKLENKYTRSQLPPPLPPPPPPADQVKESYDHLELLKAALKDDWDTTRGILEQAGEIRGGALHVAVGSGKTSHFVENLVQMMSDDELAIQSTFGSNALYFAALIGNTDAAKILVDKLPALMYVPDTNAMGLFPIHAAAKSAHRDTLEFLISKTRDDLELNPYAGLNGLLLFCLVIYSDFYDVALHLVEKYPDMARMTHDVYPSALEALSQKPIAFPSGARFNLWERLIYSSIDLLETKSEALTPQSRDPAAAPCIALVLGELRKWYKILLHKLQFSLLLAIDKLVPHGRRIHAKKLMHEQAMKLVKCLCKNMTSLSLEEAKSIYGNAMMTAAQLGIHEIIEEIVETFPTAIYFESDDHQFYFQVAAANRCEKVFNLVYQTRDRKHLYSDLDSRGNTILHLVAKLAPPHQLNLVSGAALQMQHELQWFKQVENFVHPHAREVVNGDEKTPRMIFTEEHEKLKVDGEKWMKDTANSYIIVAALIATVVFAAAITVPGGNNSDTGYPMFYNSSAFVVFAISDAASLFTSITSLLMFLSIMTSRYAENDFLYALPNRLCIGLFTLFVSIFFMMVAFGASAYLVLGKQQKWVLIPVGALGCLPIASFVLLQFPLLWDVFFSTYYRRSGSWVHPCVHHTP